MRRDPPPPIWHSTLRVPVCRHGHPCLVRGSGWDMDYRADGYVFQTCRQCSPSTYGFGVVSSYHDLITFYAMTHAQLEACVVMPTRTSTRDFLIYLGYAKAA